MSELFHHPFFDSYTSQTNVISKNNIQDNFFEIFSNLDIVEKEKLIKGENLDIIAELDSYAGNISTSQLKNIDYSKFSNHVFFDSAVHKVKYAFEEIIKYPYDANESEYLSYITNLDGYTKYILENEYPKYKGHINFQGDSKIVIIDKKGNLLNDFKKNEIVEGSLSIINMKNTSDVSETGFTFSFHITTPDNNSFNTNENQTIFKKIRSDNDSNAEEGYFCYFTNIADDNDNCLLNYGIKTKDIETPFIKSIVLNKSKNYYINIITKRDANNNIGIDFFVNSKIVDSNIMTTTKTFTYQEFSEDFAKKSISLVLGSGENNKITINNVEHILSNFSSKMDEFIIFNNVRKKSDIRKYRNINIFKTNNIILYLKFNEIGGSHLNSFLSIDSSGNKLHGVLKTADIDERVINDTTDYKINDNNNPEFLLLEDLNKHPIILGSVLSIQEKRDLLLNDATNYDSQNSNIIFNLIPAHYFTNSSNLERKTDFMNTEFDNSNSGAIIGNSDVMENTHMTQICLIWARFFDQLKLYIDSLSGMFDLDYDSVNREDFVNSQMKLLCKIYGFDFSEIDSNRTREKSERKNIIYNDIVEDVGLVKLQNLIWKKILINSQDIIRSKGTLNSINSFINALGFDIKKYAYLEEKSHQNYINLDDSYQNEFEEIKFLNFGKYKNNQIEYDNDNIPLNKPFLSIDNIQYINTSNQSIVSGFNDDYTVELYFDLNKNIYESHINKNEESFKDKQVIMQLVNSTSSVCWGIVYLSFKNKKSKFCDLIVEYTPLNLNVIHAIQRKKSIKIENINAYDVTHYVALSCNFINGVKIDLRLTYNELGDCIDKNKVKSVKTTFRSISNPNKLFSRAATTIKIGNVNYNNNINKILSEELLSDTSFEGNLFNIKIWKKYLSESEMLRHSQDIMSIAEDTFIFKNDLVSNFYFNEIEESFEQNNLYNVKSTNFYSRFIDKNADNDDLNTCKVEINFSDDSQIDNIFEITKILKKVKSGSIDKIDNNNLNRVRILSYENEENKLAFKNHEIYPIHNMPIDYESYSTDVIELSVSSAKAINEAIERFLVNIENITDILSSNMQIYEYSYFDIDYLRNSFFENFKDNQYVDYDNLNNIFKYFDNIMNNVLFGLIPNGVNFNGFNLVYESHILERSKYQYKNKDSNISIQDMTDFAQTKFDPCKFVNKRSLIYNNNRLFVLEES